MRPDVQFAWNGDVALAYQVVGEGPRDLLVIVGYLSNLEYTWRFPEMARFYERLASFSRLILMDRRGTGLSDRFGIGEAPPLEDTMDDILAVLDAVGSAKTHVLGLWDGAMAAMMFSASNADRVSSLTLYSASAKGTDPDEGWGHDEWDAFLSEVRAGWGTRAYTVKAVRWQAPSLLDRPEALEHWLTYSRLSASPSSAVAMLLVQRDSDVTDILPTIGVPTLVLHRAGDRGEEIASGRFIAECIPDARMVELPGVDSPPWFGDTDGVLDEIETFVTGQTPRGARDRVLASVLFTDIVGSTEKAAELGDATWRELFASHERAARDQIEHHRGRFINTTGDGVLATFDGPARAVRCAQAIARDVEPLGLQIRAGVHTGEIELVGEDVRGIAVHIGARVMSLAEPSRIFVSSTVRDLVAGSGLEFEDAGEHELKGVPDRWRLYRVAN